MILVRLLPLILSALLVAAHIMRFYGLLAAILVLLLLGTLFFRTKWILRCWQGVLVAATFMWINTTYDIIQVRLALNQPWLRLIVIMCTIIVLTIFSIFWLENKKIKAFYNKN